MGGSSVIALPCFTDDFGEAVPMLCIRTIPLTTNLRDR